MLALLVIAIASGATTSSHANDSGFWLVNRHLGLTVPDTLRTWTAATTLIAVVGLLVTLALSLIAG
jgi:H+/gluconate symporter-like permease